MAQASVPHSRGFAKTLRTDTWWLEPGLIAFSLAAFFGWLTISIFLAAWEWEIGPYISPVYEPKLWDSHHWYASPAFVVLLGPVPFRATCYYYRRAYYRSFFLSPPACAVGDAPLTFKRGESNFPLILQNLHRFFMYVALLFVVFLWIGAIRGFHDPDEGWGIGLGSIFLCVNAFLLMMYTFGCHSLRHFGGGLDCFSCSKWTRTRKRVWDYVSIWNAQHRFWAWTSLVFIVFIDIYIRLVANDVITDPNTWDHF
jgi:hypothetical protein